MDTSDPLVTSLAATVSNPERVFPTLTPQQLSRIAAHGRRRSTARGDLLVEVGDKPVPFFVVLSGELQVLRPTDMAETLIVSHHAGQFSGEGSMISGRRALARIRVTEPGEVIQLDREQLLALIQTDAELSEILIRAFILRRMEFIASDLGDVVVVGSMHCGAHAPRERIPDAERPPVSLRRSRSRSRRAGAARSVPDHDSLMCLS